MGRLLESTVAGTKPAKWIGKSARQIQTHGPLFPQSIVIELWDAQQVEGLAIKAIARVCA